VVGLFVNIIRTVLGKVWTILALPRNSWRVPALLSEVELGEQRFISFRLAVDFQVVQ
jgi:hypothetical protein